MLRGKPSSFVPRSSVPIKRQESTIKEPEIRETILSVPEMLKMFQREEYRQLFGNSMSYPILLPLMRERPSIIERIYYSPFALNRYIADNDPEFINLITDIDDMQHVIEKLDPERMRRMLSHLINYSDLIALRKIVVDWLADSVSDDLIDVDVIVQQLYIINEEIKTRPQYPKRLLL